PRVRPTRRLSTLAVPEKAVFSEEGVNETAFRDYLTQKSLAVIVSRNLTTRDRADQQQPFNLRVDGASPQSLGAAGKIHHICTPPTRQTSRCPSTSPRHFARCSNTGNPPSSLDPDLPVKACSGWRPHTAIGSWFHRRWINAGSVFSRQRL